MTDEKTAQIEVFLKELPRKRITGLRKLEGLPEIAHQEVANRLEETYSGLKRTAYSVPLSDRSGGTMVIGGIVCPLIDSEFVRVFESYANCLNTPKGRSIEKKFKGTIAHEYGHVLQEESIWPNVERELNIDKHDIFQDSPLFLDEGCAYWFGNFFSDYKENITTNSFDSYVPMLEPERAIEVYSQFKTHFGISHKNPKKNPTLDNLIALYKKIIHNN